MCIIYHTFSTCKDKYYVYDRSSNSILKITNDLFKKLNTASYSVIKSDRTVLEMQERGYLLPTKDFVTQHPISDRVEDLLESNLKMLVLQITQGCNLRCNYCVYGGNYKQRLHSNLQMSEEMAFKAIDFFLEHSKNTPSLIVGFYGGEPLLEYDLIKKCTKYIKNMAKGKDVRFSMTTNGTLFNEDVLEFCIENRVVITFSIDGPQHIHDANRTYANKKGSFEDVSRALQLIQKHPDKEKFFYHISAVANTENEYKDYRDFFDKSPLVKDVDVYFNTVSTIGTDVSPVLSQQFLEDQEYDKALYYLYKLGKLPREYVSKLSEQQFERMVDLHKKLKHSGIGEVDQHAGPCIPGRQKLFVNVHGDFYPCEKVNESSPAMCIGNIEKGFDFKQVRKGLNLGQITEAECKNCWAFKFCTNCLLLADDGTGVLSHAALMKACPETREGVHRTLIEYCTMRELGFDFELEKDVKEE